MIKKSEYSPLHSPKIKDLRNTVQPYLRLHLTAKGRIQESLAEHWAIDEAAVAGDSQEAEKLAQLHVQNSLKALAERDRETGQL